MRIETSMVSYYAERAREYERIYQKPERQADLQRLREMVETSFAGADVYEVACGTGYWTEVLARSAASVLAADINEEVLTVARAKAMDTQKVEFRREDVYALAAPARKFTAGFSGFWWSHVTKAKIRDFFRGFHRVLSPGSKVMFIDNVYVEGSSTPISRTDAQGDTYQLRRLDDGSTHEVLKNFPAESELYLSVEGLAKDVRVEFLEYYWILTYTAQAEAVRGAGP
jgi:demethylmenaquinone methyltransferase/2-methoxy-6-polyprenyl-1,4-benzoquinol methylase